MTEQLRETVIMLTRCNHMQAGPDEDSKVITERALNDAKAILKLLEREPSCGP
jgi:hypothetical protein